MKQEIWGNKQEALTFYGCSYTTLVSWRKKGFIKAKESAYKKRFEYEYLLDDSLREKMDFMKKLDNRWNK